MIWEEAAFIDQEVIQKVAAPLIGVRDTVTLAISTPDSEDPDNYYNRFLDLKSPEDPEEPMFEIITMGLACDECMRANKASQCTHKSHLLPPWKSEERQRKTAAIMGGTGMMHAQENMGVLSNKTLFFFPQSLLRNLIEAEPYKWSRNPSMLYVSIDPSGGGAKSNYALVTTTTNEHGAHVIVGMDHTDSYRYEEIELMIRDHLSALRADPRYRHCVIVVFIEANMGFVHVDRIRDVVTGTDVFAPILVPTFDAEGKNRPGVWTTHDRKMGYVLNLRAILAAKLLLYAERLISVTSKPDERAIKCEFENQLRAFRRCEKQSATPEFVEARVEVSGKTSRGSRDDLAMCAMMSIYFHLETLASDSLRRTCRTLGVHMH